MMDIIHIDCSSQIDQRITIEHCFHSLSIGDWLYSSFSSSFRHREHQIAISAVSTVNVSRLVDAMNLFVLSSVRMNRDAIRSREEKESFSENETLNLSLDVIGM
jgi:hypothetical protein